MKHRSFIIDCSLQEIDTSAQSYVWYNPTIQNAWVAKILECLNDGNDQYYKVEAKQLVTILLIVIAKKDHKHHISEITSNYVGIGALNMAVGILLIRLHIPNLLLCRVIKAAWVFVYDSTIVISVL